MKNTVFGFILIICSASVSCEMVNPPEYQFEATVLHQGMDCGGIFIIQLNNLSGDTTLINGVYYAENLSSDLKIDGLEIFLNCRHPKENELSVCTTFGPGYPHVFVIDAEKAE